MGLGAIAEKCQCVFTEWDPTAKGDIEALRNVFNGVTLAELNADDFIFS